MSGKNKYPTDPAVVNIYGLLAAELSSLKAQFGLRDLSIVVRDGKYYLEADGQLIEITFVNGNFISADAWSNLHSLLGQLLEQNSFSPVAQLAEQDETVSLFGLEVGRNALEFAGFLAAAGIGEMFVAMGNNSRSLSLNSANGPVVESITSDDDTNTVTVDFDRDLNPAKLPSHEDFEIFVNGQKADISGIRIDSDKVELELSQDLQPNDQVTVRYLDQTGDLENSIQGVDGSLAGSFYQGLGIDGYIAGAQLYIDKDGDGIPDPDEILEGVTTDERGVFLLDGTLNPDNLPILVTGGTNTDTGLPNDTILSAPAGATVITPTTTIIQKMVREGLVSGADEAAKIKAAQSAIKTALGLAEDIDLLSFDPIAAIKNQDNLITGATLHKFNTSVIEILESFGKGASANVAKAATAIANHIIEASDKDLELEIDASFTDAIVDTVFTSGNNAALKANLGVVVEAIQNATTLDAIATAQKGIAVQIKSEPITNNETPIVFGTATVGATVTATIAGATYEVVAGPDGKWLVDTSTATPTSGTLAIDANGTNSVSVTATDAAGNTSSTITQTLTVDTTDPAVAITSADLTNDATPIISGTAETGSTVTVVISDATYEVTATGGTWSVDTGSATPASGTLAIDANRTNSVSVTATDAAGNTSSTITQTLTVDTTDPTAAITSTDLTNDATPVISGTAETGATVTVAFAGATYEVTATGGVWSVDTGSATPTSGTLAIDANGTNSVSVTATDAAGNTSPAITQTLTINTTAPVAPTLTSVADTDNGAFDRGFTVTEGSDFVVTVDGRTLNSTELAAKFTKSTASGLDTYSAKVAEFTGSETITVDATITDTAGNQSAAATQLTLQNVDTTDPSAFQIDATLEVDNVVNAAEDNTVSVIGTSTDVDQGQTVSVRLSDGSNHVDVTATVGADGTWTAADADISALSNGTITVTADVSDAAGNAATQATKTITLDNVAPSAFAIDANIEVDNVVNAAEDNTVSVTGTSTAVEQGQTVNITLSDGTTDVDVTATVGADGTWTPADADISALSNGTITVTADVSDAAGNAATQATKTITLDNVAPSIASDAAVVTTTAADGTTKTTDLKKTDKVVLTIGLGEAASNLSGLPTGTDSTIIKVDQTAVNSDWSDSGNDLLLTYTVASGVNGVVTVDETALAIALTNASITDAAGNALTVPTFEVTDPTNAINADDVFFESLIFVEDGTSIDQPYTASSTPAGTDGSGDNSAELVLDVSDGSDGDTLELYVDNELVFSDALVQNEIDTGSITTSELTFEDTTNQDVALEIKVKDTNGTYIQDNGDVTWEYQW